MKTPLDTVIEEIKERKVPSSVQPQVDALISEMKKHCGGMTLEEIGLWINHRQERAVKELLTTVNGFETVVNNLAEKMSVR